MRGALAPLFVIVLLLAGNTPRAHACSCVPVRLGRTVLPADGDVDVPTDAVLRVFMTAFPEPVRASLAAEYRLRDPSGAVLPLDATVVSTRLDLRPRTPLQPSTEYTLEQVFAFGPDGVRLADTARWHAPAGAVRGAWFPVTRFRTGGRTATHAGRAPTIGRMEVLHAHGGGDCGPATELVVAMGPTAAIAPTDVVELRVRGQGVVATALAEGTTELSAGDMVCERDPITLIAGPLDVQVAIVDASGTEVGASPWRRATEPGVRPRSRPPTGLAGAGSWPSIPIVAAPPATSSGPQGCSHGLEVVARREVAARGAPSSYGDRSTLTSEGRRAWIAFPGADTDAGADPARVLALTAGRTSALRATIAGRPEAMVASARGPVILSRVYAADAPTLTSITVLTARGAPGWTAALPGEGRAYRLARGGGQVLAAWAARRADFSTRLAFALLDEEGGALLTHTVSDRYGIDPDSEGPAAAFVDGRFLVVWSGGVGLGRGPTRAAAITGTTLGPAPIVRVESDGPMDLASAGARAALVTSSHGEILWALLDRDGRVAVGPVVLSGGVGGDDNRLPRVAWDGQLFAVAWQSYPEPGAYVAVVDASGTTSPSLRLDRDHGLAGPVGIAAGPGGWLASYNVDERAMLTELRCRASAPTGAPQRIAPAS
jgi:hypothetical protein